MSAADYKKRDCFALLAVIVHCHCERRRGNPAFIRWLTRSKTPIFYKWELRAAKPLDKGD
jgi:hypothetical protein